MTGLQRLPRPPECPDHVDWDALTPTVQHGLAARLEQTGRVGLDDDDVEFVARLLSPARRTA